MSYATLTDQKGKYLIKFILHYVEFAGGYYVNADEQRKINKNMKILTIVGICMHLLTAELLSALAWHIKSSGNTSRNGITLPVCGSVHVFRRALCN